MQFSQYLLKEFVTTAARRLAVPVLLFLIRQLR
jgi:hypothetical protein